jgi:hypothetical protein
MARRSPFVYCETAILAVPAVLSLSEQENVQTIEEGFAFL